MWITEHVIICLVAQVLPTVLEVLRDVLAYPGQYPLQAFHLDFKRKTVSDLTGSKVYT